MTPIDHPSNYEFRVRKKDNELGDMGVYLRTYLPAKNRAALTQRSNLTYLHDPELYRENKQNILLRTDTKEKELAPPRRSILLYFSFKPYVY